MGPFPDFHLQLRHNKNFPEVKPLLAKKGRLFPKLAEFNCQLTELSRQIGQRKPCQDLGTV
jgi:hypothetical protein